MDKEKNDFLVEVACASALRCFIFIFVGSYMLWWLVLDGPAKWDGYFQDEINKDKALPIFMTKPIKD